MFRSMKAVRFRNIRKNELCNYPYLTITIQSETPETKCEIYFQCKRRNLILHRLSPEASFNVSISFTFASVTLPIGVTHTIIHDPGVVLHPRYETPIPSDLVLLFSLMHSLFSIPGRLLTESVISPGEQHRRLWSHVINSIG